MKRQRSRNDAILTNFCFDDVLNFLKHGPKLTSVQLSILSKEIDTLCSNEMNLVTQNFPAELWAREIGPKVEVSRDADWYVREICHKAPQFCPWLEPDGGDDVIDSVRFTKFWLDCRTVSRSWHDWISKQFDFSHVTGHIGEEFTSKMSLDRLLSLFRFTRLSLSECVDDLSLLTNLTSLELYDTNGLPSNQLHMISQLTKLTQLLHHDRFPFPPDSLLCLTNLEELHLMKAPNITTLHTLKSLTSLKLTESPLQQDDLLRDLKRLTDIQSDDPKFFRNGKGTFDGWGWQYTGEWLDGLPHGHGEWDCSRSVDTWKMNWKGSLDALDWDNEHQPRARYQGLYDHGLKSGQGFYQCGRQDDLDGGLVYDGEWAQDKPNGFGRYFKNGMLFEGSWKDGKSTEGTWKRANRSKDGVYTFDLTPEDSDSCFNQVKIGFFPNGVIS